MKKGYAVRHPREDPAEIQRLAEVHVTAWRQAYAGFLPERFYNEDAYEQRKEMWTGACASETHRQRTVVTTYEGETVGFAGIGRPRDEDVDLEAELYMIYLLAEHHSSGAASEMLTQLIGEKSASLWVFKENPRAHAFYAKHGFEPDGTEKDLGEEEGAEDLKGIIEIRMVRR